MIRRKFVILLLSVFCCCGFGAGEEEKWLESEWNVLQKVYDDCQFKEDFVGCIKGRALAAMDKAVEQVKLFMFEIFNLQNSLTKLSFYFTKSF